MILIPYPNTEKPNIIFNLKHFSTAVIRPINGGKYSVIGRMDNEYNQFTIAGPFETKEDAENALNKFYEFLNKILNGNNTI